MCYCTEYKLSALQVTISEENTLNATIQQFVTAKISGLASVAYAENFHGGVFIQWHRVVICIWCALFVASQFDVMVLFPNQGFGEVC